MEVSIPLPAGDGEAGEARDDARGGDGGGGRGDVRVHPRRRGHGGPGGGRSFPPPAEGLIDPGPDAPGALEI